MSKSRDSLLLDAVLEQVPGLTFVVDEQGHLLRHSHGFGAVLGYSDEELVQLRLDELWAPEERAKVEAALMASTTEAGCRTMVRFRARDGSMRDLLLSGRRLIADGQAYLVGVALDAPTTLDAAARASADATLTPGEARPPTGQLTGPRRDVTWRQFVDRQSEEWKQRYDLLTLAAQQIVYDYRASGEITWGGVVEELLGYGPDEMLGGLVQWRERIHPEERQRVWDSVTDAEASGQRFEIEYQMRCKSGAYLLVRDVGYPYFNADRKVARYIGVISDITEQRRAERERERLEDSLRQAQKMESIGRLAGGIAHDFNNLLTAIGGNLQLVLMDERASDAARDMLTDAMKAVDSAANLTRQLLAFSRKQVIFPKVVDLNEIVLRLQKMLGRLLGEDVELRVTVVDNLGHVRIDEGQVEQILINLSVNARDAMPHGGRLTLETSNAVLDEAFCGAHGAAKPGEYVVLSVSDTGTGMSPEIQARLFEPFFTTKPAGKGTGLGLAMVYGAVHQNGGFLEVSSRVGQGSRFTIYLPRLAETAGHEEVRVQEPLCTGHETIVLVEDDEQVRLLAERILGRLGYTVFAYDSGAQALSALANPAMRVDLLLTDVIMPDMNGRTLADRVREMRPETRVLFASGYTEEAIVHHGVFDEGIDFIAKPYSVRELGKRVRTALERGLTGGRRGRDDS